MADFACKMNNKRIIEFGLRRISELFRPRSAFGSIIRKGNNRRTSTYFTETKHQGDD